MIKRIRVLNYKSLACVDVSLEPVTVLIGRSGTGKTNFVEAIRFLRDLLVYRNWAYVQGAYKGWPYIISATAAKPLQFGFEVWFDAPGIKGDFRYRLLFRCQENFALSYDEEMLALGDRPLFHQQKGAWVVPPAVVNAPPAGEIRLGALTGFIETTVAYVALTKGIGWYAFPENVLLQPSQPADPGLADNASNYLQAYAAFLSDLQAWKNRQQIIASLQKLNASIKSVDVQLPTGDRIVVAHSLGDKLLVLDVAQESEGFRRFLATLIALYQLPPKQTLVFEEPEKGIHPGALAMLAEHFLACPQQSRGQIILTTHGPDLLNHLPPESLRVVEMNDRNETQIGPAAPEQLEALREHLLAPGELLTVDPARRAEVAIQG